MKGTILLVDDSRAMRWATRQILEQRGFAVEEAEDGARALERVKSGFVPDGILLDVDMPVMDGIEFLKAFRAELRFRGVIVVMCTTLGTVGAIAKALDAGATEYVLKPFTADILISKLEQVGLAR